jgi:hypothetical protein
MTTYRVATYVTLEADNPKEAAMKAFVLHDEMTPEDFEVVSLPDINAVEITLEHEDKDEARAQQRAGAYFRTTNLRD